MSLEKTSEKILHIIAEDKTLPQSQYLKLSVFQRAVEMQISKLKEKGTIICVGADKGGHWEIVKDK